MSACGVCNVCKWADRSCCCNVECGPCQWRKTYCHCTHITDSCGPCRWHSSFGCKCGAFKSCQPHCWADKVCQVDHIRRRVITRRWEQWIFKAYVEVKIRFDKDGPKKYFNVQNIIGKKKGIGNEITSKEELKQARRIMNRFHNRVLSSLSDLTWKPRKSDVVTLIQK